MARADRPVRRRTPGRGTLHRRARRRLRRAVATISTPATTTLRTTDGVAIDACHDPGDNGLAIVVGHGFTGSWRRPAVRRVGRAPSLPRWRDRLVLPGSRRARTALHRTG